MNIGRRMHDPMVADRTLSQGMSLFRRAFDAELVAACRILAVLFPELQDQTDVKGTNRIALHALRTGDIKRNSHLLGSVGLVTALAKLLEKTPFVMQPVRGIKLQPPTFVRNGNSGPYYLEAGIAEESVEVLDAQNEGIAAALEELNPAADSNAFHWSELPYNLTLAIAPAESTMDRLTEVAMAARIIVPQLTTLGNMHCNVPGLGKSAQ